MRNSGIITQLIDAPIGDLEHLGFQRFIPHPYLQPWVQCYWIAQAVLPVEGILENLYPDGGTTLIAQFSPGASAQVTFNAYQGMSKMHLAGSVDRLGVRFHPGGAFQLLDINMPDAVGKEFIAKQLGSKSILELEEKLNDNQTVAQRIITTETWLIKQASTIKAQAGLIQKLLPWLMQSAEPLETLSGYVAMSSRQIERKFRQEIGLTPVHIKQLYRVKNARRIINEQPYRALADVAQDVGFYDQAHFIRQFKKVTGQTPSQYRHKKCRNYTITDASPKR